MLTCSRAFVVHANFGYKWCWYCFYSCYLSRKPPLFVCNVELADCFLSQSQGHRPRNIDAEMCHNFWMKMYVKFLLSRKSQHCGRWEMHCKALCRVSRQALQNLYSRDKQVHPIFGVGRNWATFPFHFFLTVCR